MDEDLDFLNEAPPGATEHAEILSAEAVRAGIEPVRTELVDWAAKTLHVRCPAAAAYRGAKGLVQCRLDVDRHLKHLLNRPLDGDREAMVAYRKWALVAIWLPRGSSAGSLDVGLIVLAESLVRYAPWPLGPRAARQLLLALEHANPHVESNVAQRIGCG